MTKPRVLLTRKWPESVEKAAAELFDVTYNIEDRPMGRAEMRAALEIYDAVLATVTDDVKVGTFTNLKPKARILANYGVGFSHIDIEGARAAGITVTNTPNVLNDCTADLAMTLLMMAARRAGEGEREVRAGKWAGWRPTHMIGTSITGKTLGIIGFGRIGQAMARRAHFGFGMKILAQSRSAVDPTILAETGAVQVDTVEDLLPQCDFVSLHCPGGAANRHLINADRLASMKSTGILVNTARGEVVDEAALVEALKTGLIAGAGLDVFEEEPKVHAGLVECENAVLLPHLGSATRETRVNMGIRALKNIEQFFEGAEPDDKVN
ncbi:D-glycerate dehydrogenase [Rhodobacterales bacterium 52_120_T64]|nr:D-glycerate dehydrogenase [Rhodobacterales bacterium 52_120_T64]